MRKSQRRLLALVAIFVFLLVLSAVCYMAGMARFEGKHRGFWESLEWAAETLSTTGYGADSRWTHPAMVVFVSFVQFLGVFFVFLVIPVYVLPFIEERVRERLPRHVARLRGHVVIYHYGPSVETLVTQLARTKAPFLIAESEESVAVRLLERDLPMVYAHDEEEALDSSHLLEARALVTNGRDEENAAMILRARHRGFAGEIFAMAEDPVRRKPMELAGASAVFTPKHILAAALAARASHLISPRVSGMHLIGDRLEVREVRVQPDSPLAGRTLAESELGTGAGVVVIGQWVGGSLTTDVHPEMRLEPRGILIVAGTPESHQKLADLANGTTTLRREGHFVIAGFGEVGRKVHQLLTDAGEVVRTVDRAPGDGVDEVGTAFDAGVMGRAGARDAQAIILALDSDDATLFATLIMQDCAPDVPVIARVNQAHNVGDIHRAGADFALSVSQVSGQLLSRRLLGQESIALDPNLRIVRRTARHFGGRTVGELAVRERCHCTLLAVEREGELLLAPPHSLPLQPSDVLFVSGNDTGVREFNRLFPD